MNNRWFATNDRIEEICANSFRNFHTKGLDYLCLKRSREQTLKVYFFDGDVSKNPEVVIPHNHRYDFSSHVAAGAVREKRYAYLDTEFRGYQAHEEFDYRTPLNGGDGFEWKRTAWLRMLDAPLFLRGESYFSPADLIHTLKIERDRTILMLTQFEDKMPIGVPTQSYRPADMKEPPSLSGLYDRMTPDHARDLMDRFHEAMHTQ